MDDEKNQTGNKRKEAFLKKGEIRISTWPAGGSVHGVDHALVRARPREAAPLPGPAGRGPAAPLAAWNRSANFRHFADLSANLLGKSLRSELFGIVCILLFLWISRRAFR